MDEKLIDLWPDLYFGPINLWSAPWLGRKYERVEVREPAPRQEHTPVMDERHKRLKVILEAIR